MNKKIGLILLGFVLQPALLIGCAQAMPNLEAKICQHPYLYQVQIEAAGNLNQTIDLNYLPYIPGDYGKDRVQKWPLILFLHGLGEQGDDLELLKNNPLPKTLDEQRDFPLLLCHRNCLRRWNTGQSQ